MCEKQDHKKAQRTYKGHKAGFQQIYREVKECEGIIATSTTHQEGENR